MKILGNWQGEYWYSTDEMKSLRGDKKTKFRINIYEHNGINISGTVEDDLSTGGTRGIGAIVGSINELQIEFIKAMPIQTAYLGDGNLLEDEGRQMNIRYSGKIDIFSGEVTGSWIIVMDEIDAIQYPAGFLPTEGFWKMKHE
jgi:hypothetical protein